ncbi:hypothetical protein ACIP2X_11490 [Streptomyces sp. NPDC089424]|uniref:hypothetical protein n=1 Tax=Streptomyces sp. NPDC089424 TaxID=3365917 RepID=UPI00381C76B2
MTKGTPTARAFGGKLMALWLITAETLDTDHATRTVARFDGTREEAEAALRDAAITGEPEFALRRTVRREIFRYGDGAYYVCLYGRSDQPRHQLVFRLAELVLDTAWEKEGGPAATR